jgi:hypothetical protein
VPTMGVERESVIVAVRKHSADQRDMKAVCRSLYLCAAASVAAWPWTECVAGQSRRHWLTLYLCAIARHSSSNASSATF